MPGICSRTVFRCCKYLERAADRITGAAGPYFIAFAVGLTCLGTICFFDVIAPELPYPWLTIPACVVIALNLHLHYYYVCTVPPGFVEDGPREEGTGVLWARRRRRRQQQQEQWADGVGVRWTSAAAVRITPALTTTCRRCGQTKPERTHHCRICDRCVLKYDHHCPRFCRCVDGMSFAGINQCVGLHNERHFVLFMAYLVLATFCMSLTGYSKVFDALGFTFEDTWPHHVPAVAFILTYILSAVLCLAVGVMLLYHLWSIMSGVTSVEAQDFEVYKRMASSRGEAFVNSYDLGKRRNLQLFFNVGETGYPLYTLLLPLRIMPYTDGRSWARQEGCEIHGGLREGEHLTDDDSD